MIYRRAGPNASCVASVSLPVKRIIFGFIQKCTRSFLEVTRPSRRAGSILYYDIINGNITSVASTSNPFKYRLSKGDAALVWKKFPPDLLPSILASSLAPSSLSLFLPHSLTHSLSSFLPPSFLPHSPPSLPLLFPPSLLLSVFPTPCKYLNLAQFSLSTVKLGKVGLLSFTFLYFPIKYRFNYMSQGSPSTVCKDSKQLPWLCANYFPGFQCPTKGGCLACYPASHKHLADQCYFHTCGTRTPSICRYHPSSRTQVIQDERSHQVYEEPRFLCTCNSLKGRHIGC